MELELNSLELVNNNGPTKLDPTGLSAIGLFFSAQWYPPGRLFIRSLISAYNEINNSKKRLEIIFISHDRNQDCWEAYSEDMPWPSIPFSEVSLRFSLTHKFQVLNSYRLIILSPSLKVITSNGIEDLKKKGIQSMDSWLMVSNQLIDFKSSPNCYKGHFTNFISNSDKILCSLCKSEIIIGWNCTSCELNLCQLCQEWLCNSHVTQSEKLLCSKGHALRETEKVNEYYLRRFLNEKYSCRTCNKAISGNGLHCRECVFDVCDECRVAICKDGGGGKCLNGHEMTWSYDLCAKLQEKYQNCNFRCENCKESYQEGGAFTCMPCEYYCCVPCTSKNNE